MRFHSTSNKEKLVLVSEAIKMGLSSDGLFVPEYFPNFKWQAFDPKMTYAQFASKILSPFFEGDTLLLQLDKICHEALNFEMPLKKLDAYTYILELFHGPTLSFKDVGARFLAGCLSRVPSKRAFIVLVATSGDTGSAVASAFYGKQNCNVVVLYPENKISNRQEKQITCWGGNVLAVSVKGTFDDCQQLIKLAFSDSFWHQSTRLNTANSINIGRLLPQMTYYAYTSWHYYLSTGESANFIVPSGNIGNVTAAFWAKQIGFPINEIILSQNENNVIGEYIQTGKYKPKATIETYANAMDVGRPSNFERLQYLFPSYEEFIDQVKTIKADDNEIAKAIKMVYQAYKEIICPHTATAFHARSNLDKNKTYIVVSTAHPAKFEQIIEPILNIEIPPAANLSELLQKKHYHVSIDPQMKHLLSAYKSYF